MGSLHLPDDNFSIIIEKAMKDKYFCTRDGSVKYDFGTYTYIIEDNNNDNRFYGWKKLPDGESRNSSLKEELHDLLVISIRLGMINNINTLNEQHSFRILCDKKEETDKMQPTFDPHTKKQWM